MPRKIKNRGISELSIENIKAIMTEIGGCTKEHLLYAVTSQNEVYKTREFDLENLNIIKAEYIGKLKHYEIENYGVAKIKVPDAVSIKLYEVVEGKLNLCYSGYLAIGDKPKLVRNIQALAF